MRQIPLAIGPDATPTFEGYVAGPNAQALEHLRQLGPPSAPVYLWGPSGSGKTHLLRALAHERQCVGETVGCFDAGTPAPWPFDARWSIVMIDGCQQLDAAQQQAAFALFVEAAEHGVPIVAAGTLPPVDLPLRDDLRSRLGWGHVFALQPLGENDTRAVLRRDADRRGIFLSDEVMDWLLVRFERDLKHLVGLLDRIDSFALAQRRQVTLPLLRQMLREDLDDGSATDGRWN